MWVKRSLFSAVLGLLALQAHIVKDHGEPYPAIWAPGFDGTAKPFTEYTCPSIHFIFADGSEYIVGKSELLAEFPGSHRDTLMLFLRLYPTGPRGENFTGYFLAFEKVGTSEETGFQKCGRGSSSKVSDYSQGTI